MSRLEVGMYVRLQNDAENIVIINRIANVFETTILTENDGSIYQGEYTKENVIKASYNIIDILEEGDYVNGYYVSKIWKENEITHYVGRTPIKRKEREITIQAPSYGGIIHLKNKDIKSVLTKEQFDSISYRIGG